MRNLLASVAVLYLILLAVAQPRAEDAAPPPRDVVLVLDNSGSMKKNDPGFLARQAVTGFIEGLQLQTHAQIILFDQKVNVAVPLAEVSDEHRARLLASLDQIDYRGKLTDSPAAIERAIYDLKNAGRPDVEKVIIFMTDGIVDTGVAELDAEKSRWLREDLAAEAADAGIHIFGIAFTENADFFLIQSLARRTGGSYFRALAPEDLVGVFARINEILATPKPKPAPEPPPEPVVPAEPATTVAPPAMAEPPPPEEAPPGTVVIVPPPPTAAEERQGLLLLAVLAAGVLVLAVVIVLLLRRRGASAAPGGPKYVPRAYLNDVHGITRDPAYEIGAKPVMIGRVAGSDRDLDYIVVNQSTIGRRHSLIEYKDFSFWIIDQGSVNGTYVNGLQVTGEQRLKHGDRVRLHNFEFEFVVPELADSGKTVYSKPSGTDTLDKTVVARAPADLGAVAAAAAVGDATEEVSADELAGGEDDSDFIDITGVHAGGDEDDDEDDDEGDGPRPQGIEIEINDLKTVMPASYRRAVADAAPAEEPIEGFDLGGDDADAQASAASLWDEDDTGVAPEEDAQPASPAAGGEPDPHERGTVVLDQPPLAADPHERGTVVLDQPPLATDPHERGTAVLDQPPSLAADAGAAPAQDFHEEETVVRPDAGDATLDSFIETDTFGSDADRGAQSPPAADANLDDFISTSLFEAGSLPTRTAPPPVLGSEDPTWFPGAPAAPAGSVEAAPAAAPDLDTEAPTMMADAPAGTTLPAEPATDGADEEMSLDDFVNATRIDSVAVDDEGDRTILPEQMPEDDDADRTVMPSQVDDDPERR
ncbi:MAG: VWA domain-containing protein [Gammaproteobacteria bacterium]|nr:VWA domain-containing protein [Gammaproteobacteria bacterium]